MSEPIWTPNLHPELDLPVEARARIADGQTRIVRVCSASEEALDLPPLQHLHPQPDTTLAVERHIAADEVARMIARMGRDLRTVGTIIYETAASIDAQLRRDLPRLADRVNAYFPNKTPANDD